MIMYFAKKSAFPEFDLVLQDYVTKAITNLSCQAIGQIIAIDATKNACNVQIVYLMKFGKKSDKYPVLFGLPIARDCNSNSGLLRPVEIGDFCLVAVSDVNIEYWKLGTINVLPRTNRSHHLNDAIAIPMLFNSTTWKFSDYTNNEVRLFKNQTKIVLKDKIKISNATRDLKTLNDETLTALKTTATHLETTTTYLTNTTMALSTLAIDPTTFTPVSSFVNTMTNLTANITTLTANITTLITQIDLLKNKYGELLE